MSTRLNRLAVIPAREGSKRVPRKNLKNFLGKPMISYTIEAALQSGLFERVVVSTDGEEIAEVARKYGADVPFLRDSELSDDHTPISLATLDTLNRLDPDGRKYKIVAQLMANCPLRTNADVLESYEQFVRTAADSQLSVTRFGWQNPWWALTRSESLQLNPIFADRITARSQDLPELFCPTGAIWWAKADVLRREKTYHVANRTGWEIPWQRGVDIDTEDDWQIAEVLLRLNGQMMCAHG